MIITEVPKVGEMSEEKDMQHKEYFDSLTSDERKLIDVNKRYVHKWNDVRYQISNELKKKLESAQLIEITPTKKRPYNIVIRKLTKQATGYESEFAVKGKEPEEAEDCLENLVKEMKAPIKIIESVEETKVHLSSIYKIEDYSDMYNVDLSEYV